MTTMRHAGAALLGLMLLSCLAPSPARAEEARRDGAPNPPAEARRPAGGLLSHSFSEVMEDTYAVPAAAPEARPENPNRANGPALPPLERHAR